MLTWRSVLIAVWCREVTSTGVLAVRGAFTELKRSYPAGFGFISIIEKQAALPSSEVRGEISRLMNKFGGDLRCFANVMEDTGFRASAVRSVITGLLMILKPKWPEAVFNDPEIACRWIAVQLNDPQVKPDALYAAIRQLRSPMR